MNKTMLVPAEMVELIDKIKKQAESKQGLKITNIQAQQIIAKSYKTNK